MKSAVAAVFTGINQPFVVKEYPVLEPNKGMALLSLLSSGVCGTDIHIWKGKIPLPTPRIIGHEFVGRVEALGSEAKGLEIGDAVISVIACPCHHCALCEQGDDANCVSMQVTNNIDPAEVPHFHGGYAQMQHAPIENLVKIPASLNPVMTSVFACAGPTALHAFRLAQKAGVKTADTSIAVVQGLGPVGSFAVMYLAALGVKHVIALTAGDNPEREQLALRLGATEVLNLDRVSFADVQKRILDISGNLGADLVFEASGNPQAVPQGLTLLRNRGVYLVPGQYSNSGPVEILPQLITFNALHIIGSSQYSLEDVTFYLGFLENNPTLHETIASLATSYPVAEVNRAFTDAQQGKNIKTLLVP